MVSNIKIEWRWAVLEGLQKDLLPCGYHELQVIIFKSLNHSMMRKAGCYFQSMSAHTLLGLQLPLATLFCISETFFSYFKSPYEVWISDKSTAYVKWRYEKLCLFSASNWCFVERPRMIQIRRTIVMHCHYGWHLSLLQSSLQANCSFDF